MNTGNRTSNISRRQFYNGVQDLCRQVPTIHHITWTNYPGKKGFTIQRDRDKQRKNGYSGRQTDSMGDLFRQINIYIY
jgi:hypothetical protein